MFVTVITVVRNDHLGLARTIASVRAQTHRSIEFIVIDGASDDGTVDVIGSNDDIIDHWESEADHGIYDAMNKGLRRATGQLVLFLNAGDELLTSRSLQSAVETMTRHPQSDGWMFRAVRDDGGPAQRFNRLSAILFDSVGNHQAVLIRTSVHQRFPFDTRYRIKADRDVQLRMFLAGARMVSVPTAISRIEGGGVSSTAVTAKEWENLLVCVRNRVGLRWTAVAVFLALTRGMLFGVARCCRVDWESAKSTWERACGQLVQAARREASTSAHPTLIGSGPRRNS